MSSFEPVVSSDIIPSSTGRGEFCGGILRCGMASGFILNMARAVEELAMPAGDWDSTLDFSRTIANTNFASRSSLMARVTSSVDSPVLSPSSSLMDRRSSSSAAKPSTSPASSSARSVRTVHPFESFRFYTTGLLIRASWTWSRAWI